MDRVQKILEYILSICNDLEEAIQIAQLVVIALLNRKCSRLEKQFKPLNAEPVNAEPVNAEPVNAEPVNAEPVNAEPVNAEPSLELERVSVRAKLLSEFNRDVDLLCSAKSIDDFSPDENTRFNRIMNYMRASK